MENQNPPSTENTTPTDPSRLSDTVGQATDRVLAHRIHSEVDESRRHAAKAVATVKSAMDALWHVRGSRYRDCRMANYQATTPSQQRAKSILVEFAQNMRAEVTAGTNILLIGSVGTGKDHLLAALMRQAISTGHSVKWISGARLFARLREDIESHAMESATVREFTSPDVLVISDPVWDGQSLTRQQRLKLGEIVDERYNRRRAVWVSINAKDGTEAEATMGNALIDRLRDGAISLTCDWPSFRKSRAITEGKPDGG